VGKAIWRPSCHTMVQLFFVALVGPSVAGLESKRVWLSCPKMGVIVVPSAIADIRHAAYLEVQVALVQPPVPYCQFQLCKSCPSGEHLWCMPLFSWEYPSLCRCHVGEEMHPWGVMSWWSLSHGRLSNCQLSLSSRWSVQATFSSQIHWSVAILH